MVRGEDKVVRTMRRDIVLAASIGLIAGGCGTSTDGPMTVAAVVTVEVQVVARGLEFEPAIVQVPSDAPVVLRFENADIGVGHAFVIDRVSSPSTRVASAAPTVGPDVETYALPDLAAGQYRIGCAIHSRMAGLLVAS